MLGILHPSNVINLFTIAALLLASNAFSKEEKKTIVDKNLEDQIIAVTPILNGTQYITTDNCPLDHATPVQDLANHPIGAFLLRIPVIAGSKATTGFAMNYSAGNTWQPEVFLLDNGQNTGNINHNLTQPNTTLPTQAKIYGADGVIRTLNINYNQALSKTDELGLAFTMHYLVGGASPTDFLVSDNFIENFHTKIVGVNDPFLRRENAMNQANLSFKDQSGKSVVVKNGQAFLGTFDIRYVKYIELRNNNGKVLTTLQIGTYLGIPLNQFNNSISAGGSVGISNTVKISKKGSLTTSAQGSIVDEKAVKIGSSTDFIENPIHGQYNFLIAVNKDHPNSKLSYGIQMSGNSAYLTSRDINPNDKNTISQFYTAQYNLKDQIGLKDWQNVKANPNNSYNAITKPNDYFSAFVNYTRKKSGLTIGFYVQEDYLLLSAPSNGNPRTQGPNSQDFGMGIQVRKIINSRKK